MDDAVARDKGAVREDVQLLHRRLLRFTLANAYELGHPAWSILNDFLENLEGRFVETGLADADELEALSSALARHIDDPDTYVISHLFVQAWGRKPA